MIGLALYIVEGKFTVFALFFFVFEGNFPSISPLGAYIWRGDLVEVFLRYRFGGLIHGGPYFRNFPVYLFERCIDIVIRVNRFTEQIVYGLLRDILNRV